MSNQVKHTAEPWHECANEGCQCGQILGPESERICTVKDPAVRRRIVACVNSCAGISTENLEDNIPLKDGLQKLNLRIRDTEQQRDQLLAALERMNKAYVCLLEAGRDRIVSLGGKCDPVDVMEKNDQHLRDSREVIAAAKGGAK